MVDDAASNNARRKSLVEERLEFVGFITGLNTQFRDPKLIRHVGEGWTHPWKYFDSLRSYLLLTCFDLLGQPAPYKDFQTWLVAASTRAERVAAFAKVAPEASLRDAVAFVHREYLSLYGTKNAFYRFVDEILPKEACAALLYSVRIRRIDPHQNREIEVIESDQDKKAFLYEVRNSYTHSAAITGSPAGGVFPNWGDPIVIDVVPMRGWEPIHYKDSGEFRIEYSVRKWPTVLIETLEAGLEALTD